MLETDHVATLAVLITDEFEACFQGLSERAASALLTLRSRRPMEISALGGIIGVAQPTATRLVDGLEKSGLVARDPRDGRSVVVRLTPRGRDLANRISKQRLTTVDRLMAPLSAEERSVFAAIAAKLLHGATHDRAHAQTTCRYCDHKRCKGPDCPVGRKATDVETAGNKFGQHEGDNDVDRA